MEKDEERAEEASGLIIEEDTIYEIDWECMKRKGHKPSIQ